jgi:UrcA family protein
MKKRIELSMLLAIAFGLSLPLAASAASPSHFDDAAVSVSYADLNIDNAAGAKTLYARLQRASQEVCGIGSHVTVRSLTEIRKARDCYETALTSAVRKIDNDKLTDIHNG